MSGKYTFVKSLRELRFLFCQQSEGSNAVRYEVLNYHISPSMLKLVLIRALTGRTFLTRAYPTMKKNNPHTPIMMREALGIEPRVYARYGTLER